MQRQHDKAIASAERALELSPSGARALLQFWLGLNSLRAGSAKPSSIWSRRSDSTLSPQVSRFRNLGGAYRGIGRYEESVKQLQKGPQTYPNDLFIHLELAQHIHKLGREKEAQGRSRRSPEDTPQVFSGALCQNSTL